MQYRSSARRAGALAALTAAVLLVAAAPPAVAAGRWPARFGYLLQAERLGEREQAVQILAGSDRDLLILDAAYAPGEAGRWRREEIEAVRRARAGRRLIAYLSIGEAEDYRDYWRPEWQVGADGTRSSATPGFVVAPNPDWPGNYRVRYWRPAWQGIVLAALDRILATGFDGVYLDIVDAFEGFERSAAGDWIEGRINPETGRSYRAEMIAWVRRIAERVHRANPEALVVPQNGTQLLREPAYRRAIDAIGVESLFTLGDHIQEPARRAAVLADLARLRAARKPVLVVEYPASEAMRAAARRAAGAECLTLLLTARALDRLGTALPAPSCPTP